jgi:NADH-quinone oxidoreductase subunit M
MYGQLWLALLAPIIFIPLVYFLGKRIGKNISWVAFIPLLLSFLFFLTLIPEVSHGAVEEYITWLPHIRFGVRVDSLNLPIILTLSALTAVIAIYSNPYMDHSIHEQSHADDKEAHALYYVLYLAYASSMMGVVLSTNLFEFYLFFELMIIPSWALINSFGTGEREKIAFMYLLYSMVGAVIFVTGALTAYSSIHSFEIADLVLLQGDPKAIFVVATMLVGLAVKLAMFGLHGWLPFAHTEAPTPISALLSPAMIGLSAYAMIRLLIPIQVLENYTSLTLFWGLGTILYGGLMVLSQNDIKRLLAYSSISQMGLLFIGLTSVTTHGITGSLYHYVSHGFGKATLFLTAGAIMHQTGVRDIRSLGGLAKRMPLSTIMFILGCLNLAGLPPTMGAISKHLIVEGTFEHAISGPSSEILVFFIKELIAGLTIGYSIFTIRRIFFGSLPEELKDVKEAPLHMTLPIVILCLLSIIFGLYPKPILEPLIEAVEHLIHGGII